MALVSAVVPVYGDLDYLKRAVESVLQQDHDDLEVVIVHSGDPAEFPGSLRSRPEVTYEHQHPRGVAAARNRALDAASGDVVGFCDADDAWHRDKLAHQLPVLRSGADVVYSDEYLVRDGRVHRIDSPPVLDTDHHHVHVFRNGGGVGSRSVLARAECFDAERFDERLVVREDSHLWTRMFATHVPARVPKPLSYKYDRPGTLSSDVDLAYRMERLEIRDLVAQFPELEPYRADRECQLRCRYAKRLLGEGRARDARGVLLNLLGDGHVTPRVVLLSAIAGLPTGHRDALQRSQAVRWRLRAISRRLGAVGDRST